MDSRTNTQLAFTNVFVLETEISVRDEIGHKNGTGTAAETSVDIIFQTVVFRRYIGTKTPMMRLPICDSMTGKAKGDKGKPGKKLYCG